VSVIQSEGLTDDEKVEAANEILKMFLTVQQRQPL